MKNRVIQLKDLRKEVKKIGFKIKTQSVSWGRHITYVHIESGEELTGNVFTDAMLRKWTPLFNLLHSLPYDVAMDGEDKLIGSKLNKD